MDKGAQYYKIHSCAFNKEFLENFIFKKYYEKNKVRLHKTPLSNYQKAYGILLLTKSIRNRIDRKMCESNKDWLFSLPDDIRLDVGDKTQDHDTLISRQTFNFWVKIVEYYKIHNCAFE